MKESVAVGCVVQTVEPHLEIDDADSEVVVGRGKLGWSYRFWT